MVCLGLGREALPSYYPKTIGTADVKEVLAAAEAAKRDSRELLVVMGYPNFHRTILPDGYALVNDKTKFEELQGWPAIESDFYFRVYRAL